jgi:hypothetical protein
MPLVAFPSWISFRFLDWIYRKVHPKVYETSWATNDHTPSFNILQAVISSLRSSVLCLSILSVPLGLLFGFLALPLVAIKSSTITSNEFLWYIIIECLLIGILGWTVQWAYNRSVLRFMQEKSTKRPKSSNKNIGKTRHSPVKIQVRIIETTKKIRLSKRGGEKHNLAVQLKRLAWLRDGGASLAALTGIIAVDKYFKLNLFQSDGMTISLIVTWIILFLLAWLGSSLRLSDRFPLRQLRLGIGLLIHAFLVLLFAPILLFVELAGRHGRPEKQWTIIPKIGRWVSQQLRSPRLFWIPVILFASMLPLFESSENLIGKASACFTGGIISFEIIYRIFDRLILRRNKKVNRLVFLRVFGDSRRGQFLFSHIAPRWKGLGSITCIAAPDVSVHQLETDIGFNLLFGRLRQRFLSQDEAAVIGRHIDSDALGAVWEDHCFDDTWMSAVQSMLTQNAIVLMDLRGFGPQRKGCIYELGVLRDNMSIESVVFLVDGTTDLEFLKSTLNQLWKTVANDSPNSIKGRVDSAKQQQVTIFRMSDSKRKSSQQLVKLLIEACVSTEEYHQSHGRIYLKNLIDDLQLLSADASAQIKAVGGGKRPGKKVLEAGYSSDHDLGSSNFLSSWGLITDQQYDVISEVNDAVQEIRIRESNQTAANMKNDPDWENLRIAARNCLKALGKRRSAPKPFK